MLLNPVSPHAVCGGQVVSGETPAERQDNWSPEVSQAAHAYGSGGSIARAQTPTLAQGPIHKGLPARSSTRSSANLANGEGRLPLQLGPRSKETTVAAPIE